MAFGAAFVTTDAHNFDVNRKRTRQRDHVIALITVACFAADCVINDCVVAASVVLNLDLNLDTVADNIAVVFDNLQ